MSKGNISRRTFIKGLAAGAASVATLGVLQKVEYSLNNKPAAGGAEALNNALPNMTYTPGTYSASAKGIHSDVTVTMTFDEHSITDMEIDVSGETPEIGGVIGEQMREKILSAQTCNVDGVSGATVTADAIKAAAADCISQASGQTVTVAETAAGSADWLGEAPEITEISETIDTEIVVVGCGTGGWITAMTAAEAGAKVLVVEKREEPTGIREDIGAINSQIQQAEIAVHPELYIDKMEALQDIVRYGSGYVDSDLIKVWINESGEMVDWLTALLTGTGNWFMSLEGGVGNVNDPGRDKAYATGHSPHKTEAATADDSITLNSTFQAHCDELGVEWKLSTTLIRLVQEDSGRVTGIIAQQRQLHPNQRLEGGHHVRGRLRVQHRHDDGAPADDA